MMDAGINIKNIKFSDQKKLASKCIVDKMYIGETKYTRVQFIQKSNSIIQWHEDNKELSIKEEENLEKLFNKLKKN